MPAHKRGPWSQAEDQFLLSLVHTQGAHNWVRISSMIQTRSPKQCRERYHQNLKPNLNHDPITPEEGALIEQMVAEMGKRWAEIARRLHGRSDNAVKNWWNGGQNRRRRNAQRRAEMEARQQGQMSGGNPMMGQGHGMPDQSMYYNGAMQGRTYYEQSLPAIYQQQAHIPPSIMVPHLSAPPMTRANTGRFETPLPSPSAYSQLSNEAPSMISDSSASSARSPYPMNSPVDLPPLSHQKSAGLHHRLGVPGGYTPTEEDYNVPTQIHMGHEQKRPQMLQEAFSPYPMQGYRNSNEFAAPQLQYGQHQSPLPHIYAQLDQQHAQQHTPTSMPYHNQPMSATVSHHQLQLPSFSDMKPQHGNELRSPLASIDPSLEHKAPERDQSESPKERMRLSSMINA
ncbi:Myb-like DNA-binding domain-containing protein 5 [Elsinoe fawcettii]|nr:Myb-like DNA-binding domain-containing protein 5 [Elsinoe fawcettii]